MKIVAVVLAAIVLVAGSKVPSNTSNRIVRAVPDRNRGANIPIQEENHLGCQMAVSLGIGIARIAIAWRDFQPQENDNFNWTIPDQIIDCLINNDINILISLGAAPAWAGGGSDGRSFPDLVKWKAFVKEFMSRFAHHGSKITYGIWNEPEASTFLTGCPGMWALNRGRCYGEGLFATAAAARDEVDTSLRMAGPEMGTTDSRFDQAIQYMNQVMRPQDVITVHNYPDFGSTLRTYMDDAIATASGRETWLTEAGSDADELEQARHINAVAQTFDTQTNSSWTKMFIYKLGKYFSDFGDDRYSLTRSDTSERPSFWAYRSHIDHVPAGATSYSVSIQSDSGHFLSAVNNGGSDVRADKTWMQSWETFELIDLNGGGLESGDRVRIRTGSCWWFGSQPTQSKGIYEWGGSGPLRAAYTCDTRDGRSEFVISAVGGGPIGHLSYVSFRSLLGGQYWCANNGGGSQVDVNRDAVYGWETFRLHIH